MNSILLFIIILQSLSSIVCLECSDVRQSKGFGIFTKRDSNGSISHWIYDKNGKEWQFFLTERNGTINIDGFDDKSVSYDKRMINRFGNYLQEKDRTTGEVKKKVSLICYNQINNSSIFCNITTNDNKSFVVSKFLQIDNPLIVKYIPGSHRLSNSLMTYTMYNRNNKRDKLMLEMRRNESAMLDFTIVIDTTFGSDWKFITEMNDTLFGQIDSILDYEVNNKEQNGWMLWFNIDDRHYYCFQTFRAHLSEQVFIFKSIIILLEI